MDASREAANDRRHVFAPVVDNQLCAAGACHFGLGLAADRRDYPCPGPTAEFRSRIDPPPRPSVYQNVATVNRSVGNEAVGCRDRRHTEGRAEEEVAFVWQPSGLERRHDAPLRCGAPAVRVRGHRQPNPLTEPCLVNARSDRINRAGVCFLTLRDSPGVSGVCDLDCGGLPELGRTAVGDQRQGRRCPRRLVTRHQLEPKSGMVSNRIDVPAMSYRCDTQPMTHLADIPGLTTKLDIEGVTMRLSSPADLGAVVRAARRKLGLSQQELAERSGMSRQSLVALEQARLIPLGTPSYVSGVLGMNLSASPGLFRLNQIIAHCPRGDRSAFGEVGRR